MRTGYRVLSGKKRGPVDIAAKSSDIRECLTKQLDWRFAERNDAEVAQVLYGGEAVDGVQRICMPSIDLVTLILLAMRIVQIQDNEAPYLLDLVRQAQTSLAPHRPIVHVVIAKHKMAVYITALAKSVESPLVYERIETIIHGRELNQASICATWREAAVACPGGARHAGITGFAPACHNAPSSIRHPADAAVRSSPQTGPDPARTAGQSRSA
jgi:hypothetical protein